MTWSRSSTVAEGILAGSPALECEFVEHFLPRVKTFFRARGAHPDLVEELTQECIIAALLALRGGKLREENSMESFVLGIARRQLAESFRGQAKNPASPIGDDIERALAAPALAPEIHLSLRKELDDLAPTDQQILWLILVEGFRPAEVATQLRLSEDAIRQRKSRLLRRLAEKLQANSVTNPAQITTIQRKSVEPSTP